MYFINKLSDNELIELINKFQRSEKEPNQIPEQIGLCDREALDDNGNYCIEIYTNKGRHPSFGYVFTDTTLNCYFLARGQLYHSYNLELQAYLTERFGKKYTDFLYSIQSLVLRKKK